MVVGEDDGEDPDGPAVADAVGDGDGECVDRVGDSVQEPNEAAAVVSMDAVLRVDAGWPPGRSGGWARWQRQVCASVAALSAANSDLAQDRCLARVAPGVR